MSTVEVRSRKSRQRRPDIPLYRPNRERSRRRFFVARRELAEGPAVEPTVGLESPEGLEDSSENADEIPRSVPQILPMRIIADLSELRDGPSRSAFQSNATVHSAEAAEHLEQSNMEAQHGGLSYLNPEPCIFDFLLDQANLHGCDDDVDYEQVHEGNSTDHMYHMQALQLIDSADESTEDEFTPAVRAIWDAEAMTLRMEEFLEKLKLDVSLTDNTIDTERDPRINATHSPSAATAQLTSLATIADCPVSAAERSERLKSVGPSLERSESFSRVDPPCSFDHRLDVDELCRRKPHIQHGPRTG